MALKRGLETGPCHVPWLSLMGGDGWRQLVHPRAKGRTTRVGVTSGVGCGAVVRGRAHKWLRSSVGNGPVGIQFAARPAQHGGARPTGYAPLTWGPILKGGASQGAQPGRLRSPKRAKAPRSEVADYPPTKGARLHGAWGQPICCCGWGCPVWGQLGGGRGRGGAAQGKGKDNTCQRD